MKSKLYKALMAGTLLTMGGLASAQPVALTNVQMDRVAAGGIVNADALATAFGLFTAYTQTTTNTVVTLLAVLPLENTAISVTAAHADSHSEGVADGIAVFNPPE